MQQHDVTHLQRKVPFGVGVGNGGGKEPAGAQTGGGRHGNTQVCLRVRRRTCCRALRGLREWSGVSEPTPRATGSSATASASQSSSGKDPRSATVLGVSLFVSGQDLATQEQDGHMRLGLDDARCTLLGSAMESLSCQTVALPGSGKTNPWDIVLLLSP